MREADTTPSYGLPESSLSARLAALAGRRRNQVMDVAKAWLHRHDRWGDGPTALVHQPGTTVRAVGVRRQWTLTIFSAWVTEPGFVSKIARHSITSTYTHQVLIRAKQHGVNQ